MAFSQQQKITLYSNKSSVSSEESSDYTNEEDNELIINASKRIHSNSISEASDIDWNAISESSNITSPLILFNSETESFISSARIISDVDEDESLIINTFLPSHDGTGAFLVDAEQHSEEYDNEYKRIINNLISTDEEDGGESSNKDSIVVDLTLPYGGIKPPSFVHNGKPQIYNDSSAILQNYKPPILRNNNEKIPLFIPNNKDDNPQNIPISFLSLVWNSIRKLSYHLIENDTNTLETISTIMSEAVFDGYLPFNSHLHMEFDNTLHTTSSIKYSIFEGNI